MVLLRADLMLFSLLKWFKIYASLSLLNGIGDGSFYPLAQTLITTRALDRNPPEHYPPTLEYPSFKDLPNSHLADSNRYCCFPYDRLLKYTTNVENQAAYRHPPRTQGN